MRPELAVELLESIAARRLALFIGAGLSIPAPSNVPKASDLAQACAERHRALTGEAIALDEHDPLGRLAAHFKTAGRLETYFLRRLVDWRPFRGYPNLGHEAVADFACARIADPVVTTNVDTLIELAAAHLGDRDFRASTNAGDANILRSHAPLIKVHGCCHLSLEVTLWCSEQLVEEPWETLIRDFGDWLRLHLMNRDVVFVGYWTEWAYLQAALDGCLTGVTPRMVVLVDPSTEEQLQLKAETLWHWAHAEGVRFFHEPMSGDAFLDELRRRYSERFLFRVFDVGRTTFTAIGGAAPDLPDLTGLSTRDLYDFRRDVTGTSRHDVVRERDAGPDQELLAHLVFRLLRAGATVSGSEFVLGGRHIRVVLTSGALLGTAVRRLADPHAHAVGTTVVCVGARDDGGLPSDIVRSGSPSTVIRPSFTNEWVTDTQAMEIFGIQ